MKKTFVAILLLSFPLIVSAETFQTVGDVLSYVLGLVNDYFIPLLVAIALAIFFYRNAVFLAKKDELASKPEAKWYLFWAVIAFFVMISVWGLVGILADAFGVRNVIPQLNTGSGGSTSLPPCSIARPGVPCDEGTDPLPCGIARPGDPCTGDEDEPFIPPWE